MITMKSLEDRAAYAVPFSSGKCSVLTEICVDMKGIHCHVLASLLIFALPALGKFKSDL